MLIAPIVALGLFVGSFLPTGPVDTPLGLGAFYVDPNSPAALGAGALGAPDETDATKPDSDAGTKGGSDAGTETGTEGGSEAGSEASRLLTAIAAQPTATWLTPEKYPTDTVQASVTAMLDSAALQGELPVFVIYGIPNRDCGNHSTGGLSESEYPVWVSAIAEALMLQPSAVILEPDSLALATECNVETLRVAQISQAVDTLSLTPAVVYLDGGHSNWLNASTMADLLVRSGVERVRGFATNVSNYNTTAAEHAYGEKLSALTGGSHYVVDTSRNGRGSNGEWCNPAGRALGSLPAQIGRAHV